VTDDAPFDDGEGDTPVEDVEDDADSAGIYKDKTISKHKTSAPIGFFIIFSTLS